jgi:hypothetical protein
MSENQHRNPFEDHINGETFDVSRLDNVPPPNEMDMEIQAFFDSLPKPLNHELWDTELDDRQKTICAYLTTEMVEHVMRVYYAEELQDLSDDQLIYILTVPVTLAMLAEEHLHDKFQAAAPEKPETVMPVFNHPNAFANNTAFDFSAMQESLRGGWQRLKGFFVRLFNRL